jgi:CheY-like chemotaxis protein
MSLRLISPKPRIGPNESQDLIDSNEFSRVTLSCSERWCNSVQTKRIHEGDNTCSHANTGRKNESWAMNSVLIVDDEGGIRRLVAKWLSEDGYDVREAPDAEAALREMARDPADVVMCDVRMPGRDGLWLADQLRARFPPTAIVLATGLDSIPGTISLKSGVVEYVVKPFERELVLGAVSRAAAWHTAALTQPLGVAGPDNAVQMWLESEKE